MKAFIDTKSERFHKTFVVDSDVDLSCNGRKIKDNYV